MPGYSRMFMPKYGSGSTWFLTRPATTVLGTVMGYQPSVEKPGDEICSPAPFTFADDCSVQPSASGNVVERAGAANAGAAIRETTNSKQTGGCSFGINARTIQQHSGVHQQAHPRAAPHRGSPFAAVATG